MASLVNDVNFASGEVTSSEFATDAEAITGVNDSKPMSPKTVAAKLANWLTDTLSQTFVKPYKVGEIVSIQTQTSGHATSNDVAVFSICLCKPMSASVASVAIVLSSASAICNGVIADVSSAVVTVNNIDTSNGVITFSVSKTGAFTTGYQVQLLCTFGVTFS